MYSNLNKRIFLVGCPRSGTTLLQSLISSHPSITSFPETKFFVSLVGQERTRCFGHKAQSTKKRFRNSIDNLILSSGFLLPYFSKRAERRILNFLNELEHIELRDLYPKNSYSAREAVNGFLAVLDKLAIIEGKELWIEKTPDHLNYIDVIRKFVPTAKFIHLVRNGADTVASLRDASKKYPDKHWGNFYDDLDNCTDRWNISVQLSSKYIGKPNHFLVRYEKLIDCPEKTLKELCNFLGVDFHESMLQSQSRTTRKVIRSNEAWKENVGKPIYNANQQKFFQIFNDDERRYILRRLIKDNLQTSTK